MTMGQIIKKLRKEHGFTQEELAERIGVTYQAVSKWENGYGMPDISLIVPLASVFDVSTDVLFGIDRTTEREEAIRILSQADAVKEYGNLDSYLKAYAILLEGTKKYPNNLMLMNNCLGLGLALSMPDNGWLYDKEQAKKITSETIHHANVIIANSKNVSDILRARQCLVFLYSANEKFDLATAEAYKFPVRTDFTFYSNMARVNEYMGNHEQEATYLCHDIDYSLQAFEDNIARLGMAYYNSGHYADAIAIYEGFFDVIKAIFKEECPPPYHDFDSGDCYLLLAKSYLAVSRDNDAMSAVENAVTYYLTLLEKEPSNMDSPFVKKRKSPPRMDKNTIKKKLLEKLSNEDIQTLSQNVRFIRLYNTVNDL
jgi:transcriptional regulator with XRE-family HTH domain